MTMSYKENTSHSKSFFRKNEKVLASIVLALLCIVVCVRISTLWGKSDLVDAHYFVETSRLILQGISPYNPETNYTKYKYPLQSPSMSLLSMPLCFLPEQCALLFFFLGAILAFFGFTILVFHFYGFHFRDYVLPRWKNLPLWIVFFLIFTSSPFLLSLRHGQNSSWAAFFLFLALLYPKRDKKGNILFLGLAAALKYSLLTMQAPVFLIQKRWRLCVFSFLLFICMVLAVGFWLDGIIPAIREYLDLLIKDTQHGANSYANKNSLFFIHIGFIRNNLVNTLIKFFLLALYGIALRIIWLRGKTGKDTQSANGSGIPGITALECGTFTTLTMAISYHRAYDGILFVPFLGVILLEMLKKVHEESDFKTFNLFWVLGTAGLLLFWSMPFKIIYAVETWIAGIFPSGQTVFQYSNNLFQNNAIMFPLAKIILLGTVCFLFALEFFHSSDFSTGAGTEPPETEKTK